MGYSLRSEAINPFCSLGQGVGVSDKDKGSLLAAQNAARKADRINNKTATILESELVWAFQYPSRLKEVVRRINMLLPKGEGEFIVTVSGLQNIKAGSETVRDYFTQTAAEKAIEVINNFQNPPKRDKSADLGFRP